MHCKNQHLSYFPHLVLRVGVISILAISLAQTSATSQIIPTNNWGSENSQLNLTSTVNGQPATLIEGGAIRTRNLFHSFQQFNINAGQRVYFTNPTGVSNIFSRIIGGQASNISGTLGVDGAANLFLLNPQGIVFSPTARLDIRGSLVATTANAITFGNQGQFSITPSAAPAILTVAPSALEFAANQGAIVNQSPNLGNTNRASISLLGSQVNLDGGSLNFPGGNVTLSGINGTGTLALQQSGKQFQIVSLTGTPADVTLENEAKIDVRSGNGGTVDIQANNFTMQGDDTTILAGIAENSGGPTSRAGDIQIAAAESIIVQDSAAINNSILENAQGTTGETRLTANNIRVLGGANISSQLFGQGNLGAINLNAENSVQIDELNSSRQRSRIRSDVTSTGIGNGSDITVNATSLDISRGAGIQSISRGQGNTGKIILNIRGRTQVFGESDINGRPSRISAGILRNAQGNSGGLQINTKSLFIQDGGVLNSSVEGIGNGGPITINALDDVIIEGETDFGISSQTRITSGLRDSGTGKSGDITIRAKSLFVQFGGLITAGSTGKGDSGQVDISVRDRIVVGAPSESGFPSGIGSSISRLLFPDFGLFGNANGRAGTVQLSGREINLVNGGFISSTIRDSPGAAGQILLNATERVLISGTGESFTLVASRRIPVSSGLYTSTTGETSAPGGTISVSTPDLELSDRALISASTNSAGPGGQVQLNATRIRVLGGAQISTSTTDSGKAGDILINASDRLLVSGQNPNFTLPEDIRNQPLSPESAILANTAADSRGDGGTLTINAGLLSIQDGARVSVAGQGTGIAGAITLNGRIAELKDRGALIAETSSATGGDINLNLSEVLLLRRRSQISTTAGTAGAGGNGGNINIRSPFVVSIPNENNDITANAFSGAGGRVNISALNLFGIQARTRLELEQLLDTSNPTLLNPNFLSSNDITAISQTSPDLSGDVTVSQLDVDPTQAAARLPDDLLDRSNLINQSLCRVTQGSQFVLTGRGGLPTVPTRPLTPMETWEDLRLGNPQTASKITVPDATRAQAPAKTIVEAQGFQRSANGQVHLTAMANQAKSTWSKASSCSRGSLVSP